MNLLHRYLELLIAHFGPQNWWPADTPFEVMVGAILTQNTAWGNVEKAIESLKKQNLLEPHALASLPSERLEEIIKPTGYYRQKTKKLKSLLGWLVARCDGSVEELKRLSAEKLRGELLGLWGIGPETADSILCYALGKPVFVVDAYTVRVWSRHGLIEEGTDYATVQVLAQKQLPDDTAVLNEAHALFVAVGKHYCRKAKPLCEECPLYEMLPL